MSNLFGYIFDFDGDGRTSDDGIAETQEWMKYGIEKLQRHNPDKTFEKEIEYSENKVAAYETVKRVLFKEESVSAEKARSAYEFWKDSTSGYQATLRTTAGVLAAHANKALIWFKLATVMKEYLKVVAPDILLTEEINGKDDDSKAEQIKSQIKCSWSSNAENEECLAAIKSAREALDVAEEELNKLITAMGEER